MAVKGSEVQKDLVMDTVSLVWWWIYGQEDETTKCNFCQSKQEVLRLCTHVYPE